MCDDRFHPFDLCRAEYVERTQMENDSRLRELEEKMNRLLKELESLKGEKSSTDNKAPSPANVRPARETLPITS